MRNRYPWRSNARFALLVLALSVLTCPGCVDYSTGSTEVAISGPYRGNSGTTRNPNLYLTNTYPKPARVTLFDDSGRAFSSCLLPGDSWFKIGIKGEDLVGSDKSGETVFSLPVSATSATTLRHDATGQEASPDQFTILLHVETGSRDTIIKIIVELP